MILEIIAAVGAIIVIYDRVLVWKVKRKASIQKLMQILTFHTNNRSEHYPGIEIRKYIQFPIYIEYLEKQIVKKQNIAKWAMGKKANIYHVDCSPVVHTADQEFYEWRRKYENDKLAWGGWLRRLL